MALRWLVAATAALVPLVGTGGLAAKPVGPPSSERTRGGDAVIHAADDGIRRDLRRLVDGVVGTWEETTGFRRGGMPPVIVRHVEELRGGDGAATYFFIGEGGTPKVQVDCSDAGGSLVREVFRALLLRVMHHRNPPAAGDEVRQPPGWFLDALTATHAGTASRPPPGVHAALIGRDGPPVLEDVFRERPGGVDSLESALQAVRSGALLRVLVGSKEGRKGLRDLIRSGGFGDAGEDGLGACFPSLGGGGVLARMWTLELARGSMPSRFSSLGVAGSEDELASLLAGVDPSGELGGLAGVAAGPAGRERMIELASGLLGLHFRAHPVMKPVIEEYRVVAMMLAERPRSRVAGRIAACEELRLALTARQSAIRDHMNWFEAARLDDTGGSILDGFTAIEVPARTDPITRHLDAVERRGW